ncbi:HU family DNA-binding protein [Prevotellamassilia timonensis]|uniref:HU family DNA-binding protein n=1 Tax=Prevotellamassilia timonensis TaxID=1852370 RepID=UPI00307ACC2B
MIQYKISSVKSPKTGQKVYFPAIVQSGSLSLNDVVYRITKRSTMHAADIKAVLSALEQTVGDALTSGHSVRLGDLGSFSLTCTTTHGEDNPKLVTTKQVKKLRIRFTPSAAMKQKLGCADARTRSMTFGKAATPET